MPGEILVKFIDHKKDGQWHRLAVDFHGTAYVCSDQVKAIERIVDPVARRPDRPASTRPRYAVGSA